MVVSWAVFFLIVAAIVGMCIDAERTPGTPRNPRKQIPTLVLLAISLVLFAMAGMGY